MSAVFAPAGGRILTASADQTARLWDWDGKPLATLQGHTDPVRSAVFARDCGYTTIILWTNDILVAARRIYESVGFRLVKEEPHRSFGHDLVGQYWGLKL